MNRIVPIALALALLAGACSNRARPLTPRVDPELLNLTKEEVFARAEEAYEARKWARARRYYSYVYENYPNDPLGRRGLLRVADSYFKQGDQVSLVEAQYKYRDFINRYPGSESADYAMLQIANVAYKQMERPDRDQTKTFEAIEKYKEMLAAFPRSEHREEAEEKLREAYDRLATHDHQVARFYMRRGNPQAALPRLNKIVDEYPNYVNRDQVFYDLGEALDDLGRSAEARLYYERVIAEFPESDWADRAKARLEDIRT